jgi:hypothetical protein
MNLTDLLAEIDVAEKGKDKDTLNRLRRLLVRSVHLVGRGANRRDFAVRKGESEMPMDNIFGLDIVQTDDGLVTVGKANRDRVSEALKVLAAKLDDEDADEKELAASAKAIVAMLAQKKKAEDEDEEDEEKSKSKQKAKPDKMEDEEDEEKSETKKAKPAKEDEEPEEKKKAKPAKEDEEESDDGEKAKAKSASDFSVDDAFALIAKAGRRMSATRLGMFKQAMDLLRKLADELEPEDQKKMDKLLRVAKSVVEDGEGEGEKSDAIGAGNSATKVAKSDSGSQDNRSGRSWGVNINNPDLHRDTADPATSFFDR